MPKNTDSVKDVQAELAGHVKALKATQAGLKDLLKRAEALPNVDPPNCMGRHNAVGDACTAGQCNVRCRMLGSIACFLEDGFGGGHLKDLAGAAIATKATLARDAVAERRHWREYRRKQAVEPPTLHDRLLSAIGTIMGRVADAIENEDMEHLKAMQPTLADLAGRYPEPGRAA